jgi:hypothetical protein
MDHEQFFSSIDEPAESDGSRVSYTFDDNNIVQALVKTDDEGTMYIRDNADWAEVGKDDDAPELFDRTIVDVSAAHVDEATRNYDTAAEHKEQLNRDDVAAML